MNASDLFKGHIIISLFITIIFHNVRAQSIELENRVLATNQPTLHAIVEAAEVKIATIDAFVKFQPHFLNKKYKQDIIGCLIELTSLYPAQSITKGSVCITKIEDQRLSIPVYARVWPWSYNDFNQNNIENLYVVFNREDLIMAVEDRIGCVQMTIHGEIEDRYFEGIASLFVFNKRRRLPFSLNNNTGDSESQQEPETFLLKQNYPDPFKATTFINFQLPFETNVIIKIYSALGQEIKTLLKERKQSGHYTIGWDATNGYGQPVVAGLYFYQLQADNYSYRQKIVLLK